MTAFFIDTLSALKCFRKFGDLFRLTLNGRLEFAFVGRGSVNSAEILPLPIFKVCPILFAFLAKSAEDLELLITDPF